MKKKPEIERLAHPRPCNTCGRAAAFIIGKTPICQFCVREVKS